MADIAEVEILAASNAADRGLRALADLAAAGSHYRVVGGHRVHLLGRLYPTDTAARVTADADAGMETRCRRPTAPSTPRCSPVAIG